MLGIDHKRWKRVRRAVSLSSPSLRIQESERATLTAVPMLKQPDPIGGLYGSLGRSPRQVQLRNAAERTLAIEPSTIPEHEYDEEPFIALRKIFSTLGNLREFYPVKSYLERLTFAPGHVLWRQGDAPDGLYIVESGVLKATYAFAEHTQNMEETMCAGTLAGELSALSDLPRNATVVVERPAVLWKLSTGNLRRLRMQKPELATAFTLLVLKCASVSFPFL